jgi:hypothetical protein
MNAWASISLGMMVIAVAGDTEAARKDRAALQGTWRVIASVQDGERVPADDLKDLF